MNYASQSWLLKKEKLFRGKVKVKRKGKRSIHRWGDVGLNNNRAATPTLTLGKKHQHGQCVRITSQCFGKWTNERALSWPITHTRMGRFAWTRVRRFPTLSWPDLTHIHKTILDSWCSAISWFLKFLYNNLVIKLYCSIIQWESFSYKVVLLDHTMGIIPGE